MTFSHALSCADYTKGVLHTVGETSPFRNSGPRWDTVKSIESLFGATKKLLMTAINLQLPEDFCVCISRLSAARRAFLHTRSYEQHSVDVDL